jgi:hypothetical protein
MHDALRRDETVALRNQISLQLPGCLAQHFVQYRIIWLGMRGTHTTQKTANKNTALTKCRCVQRDIVYVMADLRGQCKRFESDATLELLQKFQERSNATS